MATSERKFYLTTWSVEVLSEEPIPSNMDLIHILAEARDGAYSASEGELEVKQIDGPTCATKLIEQGSDPEFFELTPEGDDNEWFKS